MSTDDDLLKDTSFDREIAPKNQVGDLLVSLFNKEIFGPQKGVLLSKYPIKQKQIDKLIKDNVIDLYSSSPIKVYLTKFGKIVACGEYALRQREKRSKQRI